MRSSSNSYHSRTFLVTNIHHALWFDEIVVIIGSKKQQQLHCVA